MQVELKSLTSDISLNSSLTSITNSNINRRYIRPTNEVKKKSHCNTCKSRIESNNKRWFQILLNILYLGFIFVTFLGASLIFRKPLCYILNGLTQYYKLNK